MFSNIFSGNKHQSKKQTQSLQRVVGIDIGSSAIKIVELEDRSGVVTLVNYGELQTGPYTDKQAGESVSLEAEAEQAALLDIYQAAAIKSRSAVLALPLASSFVTVVELPAESDDISSLVRVEAKKYIPIPINKVSLDWLDLGIVNSDAEETDEQRREILLAAIQNTVFERSKLLLDNTGFQNVPMEIECFSAVRGMYKDGQEFSVAIDIGAVFSKLYILKNGVIQRIHRARGGGALCTAQFATDQQISFAEAEEMKKIITPQSEHYNAYKKIYHNQLDKVLKEFGKVIADYQKVTGANLAFVELTGGGSLFPGLSAHVSDKLQLQTHLADTFNRVAYPLFMEDTLKAISPVFTVALGAALRSFDY